MLKIVKIAQIYILLTKVNALYFLVKSGDPKCFTIEQPKDTPIVFGYEILDKGHSVNFDLYYGAFPKPDMLAKHKTLTGTVGHIDYATDNDGFYSICFQRASAPDSHPTRLRFSINFGYDSEHYSKLAKEQKFDALNLEIHKLNDQMRLIVNEADYQKHKEVIYHHQTERMNSAALWWPMLQIGILLVTGVFQVQHLKNFFKSSKLI